MTYHEFIVPTEEDLEEILGVMPRPLDDEVATRVLSLVTDAGDQLRLSYDVTGRSVRLEWERGETRIVEIVREGATRLSVEKLDREVFIRIRFETDTLAGELQLRVAPEVNIRDKLLIH